MKDSFDESFLSIPTALGASVISADPFPDLPASDRIDYDASENASDGWSDRFDHTMSVNPASEGNATSLVDSAHLLPSNDGPWSNADGGSSNRLSAEDATSGPLGDSNVLVSGPADLTIDATASSSNASESGTPGVDVLNAATPRLEFNDLHNEVGTVTNDDAARGVSAINAPATFISDAEFHGHPPAPEPANLHSDGPPLAYSGDLGNGIGELITGASGSGSGSGTGSGGSGTVSPTGHAGSGFVINVNWDASVSNAPSGFVTAVNSVVNYYESHFSNPVTITIDVGYGEIAGVSVDAGALGESETYLTSVSYSQLENALVKNANAIGDTAAAASLSASSPVNGQFLLSTAEAEALGLSGPSSNLNGYVGFSNTASFAYNDTSGVPSGQYDFFGTVAHEFAEIMGRMMMDGTNFLGSPSYEPLDLFHYLAPGVRDFSGTTTGYFSANGGATNLGNFNTNPGGDFGDWASSVGANAYLAFSNSGVVNSVTPNDLTEMNLLGWDPITSVSAPVVTIALTHDTGGSNNITSNDALTGSADANAVVRLTEGSTLLGTTTANSSGVWSFTPTGLTQGSQTITASETNAAGLTGSASLTFTYDTVPPRLTIALAHDTGGPDNITSNDALTGSADANAVVRLTEGSTILGTATANSSGVWSFTPTGLAQGSQNVTASETNAAGLTGSASLTFTYDTVAPTVISETISGTGVSADAGTLTTGETAVLTLALSETITVTGGIPELALNDGGVAIYDPTHSTPTALAFDYTVLGGQSTNSLAVTAVNLEGASVADLSGNVANLAGADVTFSHLAVKSVTTPTVISETALGTGLSNNAGLLTSGTVLLMLNLNEPVTVNGGSPVLHLNDNGFAAKYDAAHSTSTSLAFDYQIAGNVFANPLAVTGLSLNGASVADASGHALNPASADVSFSGLLVDSTHPTAIQVYGHDSLGGSISVAASGGVLSDESDPDPADILSVVAVKGQAANVGHAVATDWGIVTMNANGSYSYADTNLNALKMNGGIAEDTFNFNVGNGHGGSNTSTLTELITDPSDTYFTGTHGGALAGSVANEVLDGTAGNMNITAGNGGSQFLVGGAGDTLNGGNTADTFVFPPNLGNETIHNFKTAADVIDIPTNVAATFAAIQADMHASGANTVITFDAHDAITMNNVAAQNLTAHNFHFLV